MPDPADVLYALPLEAFTRERDALAKQVRADGDRDAAAAVKALRKPGAAAWIVNQLAREEETSVEALLVAGEQLRGAQADALSGSGSAFDLREAVAAERAAVDELMALVARLRPAGRAPSRAISDKVRALLHAAATDENLRELVRAGRVVSDEPGEAASLWGLGAPAIGGPAKPRAKRPATAKAAPAEADAGKAAQRAAAREAAAEERRRRAELREARAERTRLRKAAEAAASACAKASDRVEQAQASLADALALADDAQAAFDTARAAAAEAETRVSELESA